MYHMFEKEKELLFSVGGNVNSNTSNFLESLTCMTTVSSNTLLNKAVEKVGTPKPERTCSVQHIAILSHSLSYTWFV